MYFPRHIRELCWRSLELKGKSKDCCYHLLFLTAPLPATLSMYSLLGQVFTTLLKKLVLENTPPKQLKKGLSGALDQCSRFYTDILTQAKAAGLGESKTHPNNHGMSSSRERQAQECFHSESRSDQVDRSSHDGLVAICFYF